MGVADVRSRDVPVAVATAGGRVQARRSWPWIAVAIGGGVVPVLVVIFALQAESFTGPAIIAISGIIIGGSMTAHTLTTRRAFDAMRTDRGQVEAGLALGLQRRAAISLVIGRHAREAVLPGDRPDPHGRPGDPAGRLRRRPPRRRLGRRRRRLAGARAVGLLAAETAVVVDLPPPDRRRPDPPPRRTACPCPRSDPQSPIWSLSFSISRTWVTRSPLETKSDQLAVGEDGWYSTRRARPAPRRAAVVQPAGDLPAGPVEHGQRQLGTDDPAGVEHVRAAVRERAARRGRLEIRRRAGDAGERGAARAGAGTSAAARRSTGAGGAGRRRRRRPPRRSRRRT